MIFDYKCDCGKELLNHFTITYAEKVDCDCGKVMEKTFPLGNSLNINFIGSGFYCKDTENKGK